MALGASGPDSPRKPKAKRPRVDDRNGHEECLVRTRRRELWFDDGNIVIAASGIAFRVYKGLLSKSSATLAGMLSAPQPAPAAKFEGCNVLRLDDDPLDVARILEFIFCGSVIHTEDECVDFFVVASWIRMAQKYEMERILCHALARLKSFFNDNLYQWRVTFEKRASSSMAVRVEDAIIAVNLARLTQTSSILPTAFYMCCQLPSATLLGGVFGYSSRPMERLTNDDIVRCMNARDDLLRFNLLSTFQIWNPRVSHLCTDATNCSATLEHQTRMIREGSPLHQYTLSATVREVIGDVCLCVACEEMLRKRLERLQRRHWAELPHVFDLHVAGWDDRVEEVSVTDEDSYGGDEYRGDGLEDDPQDVVQAHRDGEADSDGEAGLSGADEAVYGSAPDEEETTTDSSTTEELEEDPDEDGGAQAHNSDSAGEAQELTFGSQTSGDSLFGSYESP